VFHLPEENQGISAFPKLYLLSKVPLLERKPSQGIKKQTN